MKDVRVLGVAEALDIRAGLSRFMLVEVDGHEFQIRIAPETYEQLLALLHSAMETVEEAAPPAPRPRTPGTVAPRMPVEPEEDDSILFDAQLLDQPVHGVPRMVDTEALASLLRDAERRVAEGELAPDDLGAILAESGVDMGLDEDELLVEGLGPGELPSRYGEQV